MIISTQHWAQNAASDNEDATNLDGTWCVTHYGSATMIWSGGRFVCTVPLDKQNIFNLKTIPGYIAFTTYCANVVHDPYLHDYKTKCIP